MAGVLLAGVMIVQLLSLAPASATIGCVSGYGSLFDGLLSTASGPGGTYEGASAVMVNNSAPICDTGSTDPNANFVYEWVMIHQNNSAPGGTDHGYAQSGFYRGYAQPCPYWTSEYNRDASDTFHRDIKTSLGCVGSNTSNQYWVQYVASANGGAGGIRINVDTRTLATTPWNPYSYWGPYTYGPFFTEFAAETKYLGSNVPTSNFSSMQVQQFNDAWTTTLPTMYSLCPWPVRYIRGTYSNRFFAIQTSGSSTAYNC